MEKSCWLDVDGNRAMLVDVGPQKYVTWGTLLFTAFLCPVRKKRRSAGVCVCVVEGGCRCILPSAFTADTCRLEEVRMSLRFW